MLFIIKPQSCYIGHITMSKLQCYYMTLYNNITIFILLLYSNIKVTIPQYDII